MKNYIVKLDKGRNTYVFETKSEAYEFATGLSLSTNWDVYKVDYDKGTVEHINGHRYE